MNSQERERQKIAMDGDSSRGWNRLRDVAPTPQGIKTEEVVFQSNSGTLSLQRPTQAL